MSRTTPITIVREETTTRMTQNVWAPLQKKKNLAVDYSQSFENSPKFQNCS